MPPTSSIPPPRRCGWSKRTEWTAWSLEPGQDRVMPDPLVLGRSVVVGPGARPPEPWASCERIRVTAVDRTIADELNAAWRTRRSIIAELTPGLGLDDPFAPPDEVVIDRQPWQWPVDLDLVGERLHHALWSNALDARDGAAAARWHWGDVARRLGAAGSTGGDADVVLPDGTPAICDGGPLDASLPARIATAVVHRISLEHDSLQPLGPNDRSGLALAPDQLDAVTEPGGTARIIAPAGSGKTRVLTERARLLLRGWNLPAGAVAMVGYNVRAADEIRARLADVAGAHVRTFNSLGLRLCGHRSTIEEFEVRRILGDLVTFPRRAESDPAAPWIEALSRLRLGLAQPDTVEAELPDVSDLDPVARRYRALLGERNAVDYDEQITGAIERLLADAAFRRRSQRFARVLLVDEFQDLTPAHLLLIRLLSGPAGAVYAVGDDDQTIYGYAGATPRWLVDFESWFPGAALHSLEVNYRCPAAVVVAASNLLTHNALRVQKMIRAAPGDGDPPNFGDALTVLGGGKKAGEGAGAGPAGRSGQRVQALLDAGAEARDVAVLARVNASLAPVQVMLRHAAIAVNGPIDERFLNRGGVRAALAWLAVATAPPSALPASMLREAARHPKRGMSASLVDLVSGQHSEESMQSLSRWLEGKDNTREADKVIAMADDIALVRAAAARPGATTAHVLSAVRLRVGQGGLVASATALDRWSHGAIASHGDDLDALVELAELEPDPVHFSSWLSAQLALPADGNGVTLASIHAVKGREWPHVVIHHATDGLLPHRLAEDIEEERRVFHVALTRGRSTVSISPGTVPSPFLLELAAPGHPAAAPTRRVRETTPVASPSPVKGAEPVSAAIGLSFNYSGHDYEVVEVLDNAVKSRVIGATATMTNAFGTTVRYQGQPAMLAHPRVEAAWEALREWRAKQAKTIGKPAYVVFDDKTLRLVAALLPTNEAGLLAVSGIGPVKLEAYGDDLISIAETLRSA